MTPTITSPADPVSTDVVFQRAGQGLPCWMASESGERRAVPLARWVGDTRATPADRRADSAMLDGCMGATLDLGCGPGRLTAELTVRGVNALGVDTSETAVAMTIRRGALAVNRNIFDPLPLVGHWAHVLLADGNIGIDGDPLRVLRRAASLLAQGGVVIAEVEPPAAAHGIRVGKMRWETDVLKGHWFSWATVGLEVVPSIAADAGLRVARTVEVGHRCFVWLTASSPQ
jgi:SAM-dependent methyltransferase